MTWTPERRAEQAERARKQMSDPARRAAQAAVMRAVRLNPKNRAAWLKSRRQPKRRAIDSAIMTRLHADPIFEEKRIRGARKGTSDAAARRRGGSIPAGYEQLYRYLRVSKKHSATESLRAVRLQRAADLRKAA